MKLYVPLPLISRSELRRPTVLEVERLEGVLLTHFNSHEGVTNDSVYQHEKPHERDSASSRRQLGADSDRDGIPTQTVN